MPEELTKPQESIVVTESRKLAPRIHQVLHKLLVPAMLSEAKVRRYVAHPRRANAARALVLAAASPLRHVCMVVGA